MNTKLQKGYTLIELMMAIALLSILMTIMFGFLNFNFSFLNNFNKQANASFEARKSVNLIVEEIRKYGAVKINSDGTGIIADSSALSENIESVSYGALNINIFSISNDAEYAYYFNNGKLESQKGIVAEGIDNIQLYDNYLGDDNLLIINITMKPYEKYDKRKYILSRVIRRSLN